MIRLKRLVLQNYCQHAHQDVVFHPRLTAIIGPNGAGKSNLVGAVEGAITGTFPIASDGKASNIRVTAGDKERSSVQLQLALVDNSAAEIIRSLRPSGQKLKVAGEVITRESEISERIQDWLGVAPKVFAGFAFARQWKIFSIVDDKPADRAKALGRLFRLDRAETCWGDIGDYLSSLPAPILPFDEDVLSKKQISAREELDKACVDLLAMPEVDEAAQDAIQQKLTKLALRERYQKDRARLSEEMLGDQDQLGKVSSKITEVEEDLAALNAVYSPDIISGISGDLRTWVQLQALDGKKVTLEKQLAAHLKTGGRNAPVEPPAWTQDDKQRKDDLYAQTKWLSDFVKSFDPATGISKCPKCGTLVDKLAMHIDEASAQLGKLQAEHTTLTKKQATYDAYVQEKVSYDRWSASWTRTKEGLEQNLVLLAETRPQQPHRTQAELLALQKDTSETQTAITVLEADLKQLRAVKNTLEGRLATTASHLARLDDELTRLPAVTECEEDLKKQFEELSRIAADRFRVQAQIDRCQQTLRECEESFETLVKAKQKIGRMTRWREVCERVRDAFHRDNLPKLVAQSHLEQLEGTINRYLDELGVDFSIVVEDGLGISCHFTDGRVVTVERLSGGEKVVFAIAWRLAVNSAFAADVGFLCLDEPTAGLDSDRLGCLRRALEGLRELSGRSGLQCVIVTHERSLIPLFDHVIELKSSV